MRNLLKRLARRLGLFAGVITAVLAGFEFVICAVVSTINVPALFAELAKSLPPLMKDLIVQYIGGFGPADLLAFGWAHPVALALGAAAAIVLASRAVAGEIEAGTLELVLSHPLSRDRYFAGQVVFGLAVLVIMGAAGAAATWLGQRVYGLSVLGPGTILALAASFVLLQSAWFGVTLLLSVFGREAGRVAFGGFLAALLSYLAQVVGGMWHRAAFLLPYSLYTYDDPRVILKAGGIPVRSLLVLGGIAAVCLGTAFWRFRRRDIP
ncbi:MAG TPA: ABC transporter permease [Candidatus Bathyarchaeia archaeon]|nr:ABC transporter permease [Candidatus Bathyarchaeia archaeon]